MGLSFMKLNTFQMQLAEKLAYYERRIRIKAGSKAENQMYITAIKEIQKAYAKHTDATEQDDNGAHSTTSLSDRTIVSGKA